MEDAGGEREREGPRTTSLILWKLQPAYSEAGNYL